jgi:hypothetical protein
MSTTRRWRPVVEALEDRTALSMAMGLAGQLSAVLPPGQHAAHQHLTLLGAVTGTWSRVPIVPDVGGEQNLNGAGTVQPLGAVQASGHLRTPGFVAHGRAEATFTLTAAGGSITVRLVGPLQRGFSSPPAHFHYTIKGGTGKYAGASGSGKATFQETTAPVLDPCPPNAICATPLVLPVGMTFTLAFGPVLIPQ